MNFEKNNQSINEKIIQADPPTEEKSNRFLAR